MIKAVFFDIDGTLLDTTEYIYQAFENSLTIHNLPVISRTLMSQTIGLSLEDCYKEFTNLESVMHLAESHKQFQQDNPHLSKPYRHARNTLESIHKKGIHIAAITSRSKVTADENLKRAGLAAYIHYFVGFEDVAIPKPDPEGIQKALSFFSVDPKEAIMVGDSPVDVQAGRNADTSTVGAAYGFHGARIAVSRPDFVIEDIKEVLRLI